MHWSATYLVKCALAPANSSAPYYQASEFSAENPPQLGQNNLNLMAPKPPSMVGGAVSHMPQQQQQNQPGVEDLMFNMRGGQTAARNVGQAAGRTAQTAGRLGSQAGRVASQAGRAAGQTAGWGGRLANMVGRGGLGGWGAALAGGAAAAYALPNLMWNLSGPGIGMRARNERVQAAGGKPIHTQGLMDSGSYDFSSPMQKLIPGS